MVGNKRKTEVLIMGRDGIIQDKPVHFFVERYQDAYIAELQAFIQMLREGGESPVTGEDGRRAVLLGYRTKEALANKCVVQVL